MKLYPKKLRNIDDLEREKKRLRKALRHLDEVEFLSAASFFVKSKTGEKSGKKDKTGKASGLAETLISLATEIVKSKAKRNNSPAEQVGNERKQQGGKRENPLKAIVKEFVGGYLKWKAIELAWRGIRRYLRPRAKS